MKNFIHSMQIAFTYIGTIVGAGFATGQEILQFFSKYGAIATFTILLSGLLFVWLGTKILVLAYDIKAHSYEDLNRYIFGNKMGKWISYLMMGILFFITSVMLAGAGSLFEEHLHIPYQWGLLLTFIVSFFVILKGVHGILAINSLIVPLVLAFTFILVWETFHSPSALEWMTRSNHAHWSKIWLSPFLYIGFNLSLAQAVLVPIGSSMANRRVVIAGGIFGGIGITILLLAGHIALSSEMPGIQQFEIPMGFVILKLGSLVQVLFLLLIYAEILTTLIANVYGLTLQTETKLLLSRPAIVFVILCCCFAISQIGFSTLLSTLYPLFGFISLGWLIMIIQQKYRLR